MVRAVAVATLATLSACGGAVVKSPAPHALLSANTVAATNYQIGVGDEIEFRFYFNPELNDRLTVRPDGQVSLPFLQDVQAAGRTPAELAQEVHKSLLNHIKQPDVVVTVRNFNSRRIFVGGEVARPGPVQMVGRLSILQCLTEAGWLRTTARTEELVLVRRQPDGGRKVFAINLEQALNGQDMSQDAVLQPDDMLFVPPSDVANFDRWVDQHIRQALPFSTNAGFAVTREIGGN